MRDFIAFVRASLGAVVRGSGAYHRWLAFLGAWMALGGAAAAWQFANGLGVSNLTDQVPWGVYIANFSFTVGLASAALVLVATNIVLGMITYRLLVSGWKLKA